MKKNTHRQKNKIVHTTKAKAGADISNTQNQYSVSGKYSDIFSRHLGPMRQQVKNLHYVFNPSSVAIVGASKNPSKIGHAILKNFMQGGYEGKLYPINPSEKEILNLACYPKISDIPHKVDCAIIAVPAEFVYEVLQDAIKAKVPSSIIITGGFSEIGNKNEELRIKKLADDAQMALIGPNCMGVLNPIKKVDSIFLPIYKLTRPQAGSISFISQSGAIGGCIVDLASSFGLKMAKFVSYGNALCINETDLVQYLAHDEQTKSILAYVEGVSDGRKFMSVLSGVSMKKPFAVLKAGKTKAGSQAALSHTASLSGSSKVFSAAMRQCGAIEADGLDDLFDFAKIFDMPIFFGSRVAVLTNGGGNGVLAADALEQYGLSLAQFSPATLRSLKTFLPKTSQAKNPLDIIGDATAERYEKSLDALIEDEGVDAIVVIVLLQTASLDSSIVNVLTRAHYKSQKPIIVVSTGGDYTRMHQKMLEDYGLPTYSSPSTAIRALDAARKYNLYCHTRRIE
ncbi:MAG: CoA-binding protein [Candidatus Micrarchaeia archaeon]